MDYSEALEYIDATQWHGSKPGLSRVALLLERLGNPQKKLKFVHIAGTNGKGSCAAMLASVLKCNGYRTGLFISPYLFRFNERMQINGENIPDDAVAALVSEIRPIADAMEDHPTEFELMTALGLLWYARESCDIVVLEVGLGGRLDATNVIDAPELSIIMNIGLDHTAVLGDTPEQIALEKAGIIKKGSDCVLYQQSESVEAVIRRRCEECGVPLYVADFSQIESEFDSIDGQVFSYKDNRYAIGLLGKNQTKNAAVVIEAVQCLKSRGWVFDQDDVEHGLYAASWPARFELIEHSPCFILDGGHNPQCAQTIVENLNNYFSQQRKVLLMGLLADKDYKGFADIIAPAADEFVCVTPNSDRALPAQELSDYLARFGKEITVCDSIEQGVSTALKKAGEDAMVCAAGSLYMAGRIRASFNLY